LHFERLKVVDVLARANKHYRRFCCSNPTSK